MDTHPAVLMGIFGSRRAKTTHRAGVGLEDRWHAGHRRERQESTGMISSCLKPLIGRWFDFKVGAELHFMSPCNAYGEKARRGLRTFQE